VVVTGSHVTNKVPSCGPDSTCTSEGGSGSPTEIIMRVLIQSKTYNKKYGKECKEKNVFIKFSRI